MRVLENHNISHTSTNQAISHTNQQTTKKNQSTINFFKNIFAIKNSTKFSIEDTNLKHSKIIVKAATGYVENFKGGLLSKKEDALIIHGSKSHPGHVRYGPKNELLDAPALVKRINEDHALNLMDSTKNIHVMSCYASFGGSKSFAQDLANVTGRKVKVYDNGHSIQVSSKNKKWTKIGDTEICRNTLKSAFVPDEKGNVKKPINQFTPIKNQS